MNVNRSSYYKHFHSPLSKRELENQALKIKILHLYNASDKRLGVKKMKQRLMVEYGINISVGRVYRLMKSMQLPKMSTHKNYVRRTKNSNNKEHNENILRQQFNPPAPNMVWVSDITFIRAGKRHFYLCVIMDLFARKVIAWHVSSSLSTKFVSEVLLKAWKLRKNPKSVIFHSDRGSQYTSKVFRQLIDELGFRQSLSAPGCPYDNAVVEAFFKFLKKEETNRRKFSQIEEVKQSVFSYIEGYYNKKRTHSSNSRLSPDEKEANFWAEKK